MYLTMIDDEVATFPMLMNKIFPCLSLFVCASGSGLKLKKRGSCLLQIEQHCEGPIFSEVDRKLSCVPFSHLARLDSASATVLYTPHELLSNESNTTPKSLEPNLTGL